MRELLQPEVGGRVYEEQLRTAIVSWQLYQKCPGIEAKFQEAYQGAIGDGLSAEKAIEQGLDKVVEEGSITSEDADWVTRLTFRAAQLDGDFGLFLLGLANSTLGGGGKEKKIRSCRRRPWLIEGNLAVAAAAAALVSLSPPLQQLLIPSTS